MQHTLADPPPQEPRPGETYEYIIAVRPVPSCAGYSYAVTLAGPSGHAVVRLSAAQIATYAAARKAIAAQHGAWLAIDEMERRSRWQPTTWGEIIGAAMMPSEDSR
ncbi:MAG TPA: hypothetical protein VMV10_11075 [Pirellulales bacterium]|nr:hypothetical protein [Pirellulales bacterium]